MQLFTSFKAHQKSILRDLWSQLILVVDKIDFCASLEVHLLHMTPFRWIRCKFSATIGATQVVITHKGRCSNSHFSAQRQPTPWTKGCFFTPSYTSLYQFEKLQLSSIYNPEIAAWFLWNSQKSHSLPLIGGSRAKDSCGIDFSWYN